MTSAQRFWKSPDLMAQLLPFLDVQSILALSKVEPVVVNILQRSFIWRQQLRRSYHAMEDMDEFEMEELEVGDLLEILQLVEDPEPLIPELLDMICERFSQEKTEETYWPQQIKVLVSCDLHPGDHLVSRGGFQLLELVEGEMGTTLQKALQVEEGGGSIGISEGFAKALVSRIKRQKQPLHRFHSDDEYVHKADIYSTLLQNSTEWDISRIIVDDDFGAPEFSWLADGIQRNRGVIEKLEINEYVLFKSKKADLKAIWEGMADDGSWAFDCNGWVIEKEWREDVDIGWEKIEKFFNMGMKKWKKDFSGPHHTKCIREVDRLDGKDGNICVKHNEKITPEMVAVSKELNVSAWRFWTPTHYFECGQCDNIFKSEHGLKIHVGKSHKKVGSTPATPYWLRRQPRSPVSLSASTTLNASRDQTIVNSEEGLSS